MLTRTEMMALGNAMHEVRPSLEQPQPVELTPQQLEEMQRMMQPRWQDILEQKIAARERELAPSAAVQLAQLERVRLEAIPESERTKTENDALRGNIDLLELHRLELEMFVAECETLRVAAVTGVEPEILPDWMQ